MTLETSVASLTTATTALLNAVNVQKVVLDTATTTAVTQAGIATSQATTATTQAATATSQATIATAQATTATTNSGNAASSAAVAATAQVTATAQAVISTTQSASSQIASAAAQAAKTAAEAARDAALVYGVAKVDLASVNGSQLIGNGGENVAQSFAALQISDFAGLRSYVGFRLNIFVTGYLVTSMASGIAGQFTPDMSDTTSPDNNGTIIVSVNNVRWKRQFNGATNARMFGAKADGVTDDSAAVLAALKASSKFELTPGNYLINTQIVMPSSNITISGKGGTFVRGNALNSNSVLYGAGLNNITIKDVNFTVQPGTPHSVAGQFITFETGNQLRFFDNNFDGQIPGLSNQSESLFSAIYTPSCNSVSIRGNQFKYIYGNACGANDGIGNGVNGHAYSILQNTFYNCVDTGVGCFTNARNISISSNLFTRDDYSTAYNSVHVDVAGASNVNITNNVFIGGVIGTRVVSNLVYTNTRILIKGNLYSEQVAGISSEPGQAIKLAHNDGTTNSQNMDVVIKGNTFNIPANCLGVDIVSTVTDTTKLLTFQIDGNIFDISQPNATGVSFQRLSGNGSLNIVPGKNIFIGAGLGSAACGGLLPNTRTIDTGAISTFALNSFVISTTTTYGQFPCDLGMYGFQFSLSVCTDNAGVGGLLQLVTKANVSLPNNQVVNASLSNTIQKNTWNFITNSGTYKAVFGAHPAGHTHAYDYFEVIRLI